MSTTVVHLKKEPYDVYIGRPGPLGNPFMIGRDGTRAEVIQAYREYFKRRISEDPEFRATVEALRGKKLGCFCKPMACHGDVIAEYLDK